MDERKPGPLRNLLLEAFYFVLILWSLIAIFYALASFDTSYRNLFFAWLLIHAAILAAAGISLVRLRRRLRRKEQ